MVGWDNSSQQIRAGPKACSDYLSIDMIYPVVLAQFIHLHRTNGLLVLMRKHRDTLLTFGDRPDG